MLKTQRQPALRKTDVSGCGYWSSVVYWVVCRLKKKRGGRKFFLGLGKGKLFTHFYWLCVVAKMRNVLACVLAYLLVLMPTVVVWLAFDYFCTLCYIYCKICCMYFSVKLELYPHSVNSCFLKTCFPVNRIFFV